MITNSPRTDHIAAHVRPETKSAFRGLASARMMSVSALISELVEAYIKRVYEESAKTPHSCEDK